MAIADPTASAIVAHVRTRIYARPFPDTDRRLNSTVASCIMVLLPFGIACRTHLTLSIAHRT